jgi:uncharacterized protein
MREMTETADPAPPVHANLDTAWWWQALRQGRLLVPTCRECSHRFFPPQPFCPDCGSRNWFGAESGGRGKVYSWVVIHRAFGPEFGDQVPYAIVAVDLDEGGRVVGRLLSDWNDLADALPVTFEPFHRQGDTLLGFSAG